LPCDQVEVTSRSPSASPLAPAARQTGSGYAATTFAASAWRWRCRLRRRASETPLTAMSRSGPTGSAQTTASARSSSPPASVTRQHVDGDHLSAEPQTRAERVRHRKRQRRAAGREPQALPALVAVDLLRPGHADHPQHSELNPVIATPDGAVAVDAVAARRARRQGVIPPASAGT
jgi:hypothetical protein